MAYSENRPSPDRTPVKKWAKVRLRAGYLYLAAALVFGTPQFLWAIIGLLLILGGIATRLVASATLVKDRVLCIEGIYALTRNPLYLGSSLIGLGFAFLATSEWLLGAYVLILVPIYIRMIHLEEHYLSQLFPGEFERYMKSVPRFFPRLDSGKIRGTMSREKLVRSRELTSAMLFLVIAALILFLHRTWMPS